MKKTSIFASLTGNAGVSPAMNIFLFASWMCLFISTCTFAINGDMGLGTEPLTDGSANYPYLIEDVNDFDTFADSANAATYWAADVHTKLMTDIDLSGRTYTTAVIAPDTSSDFGFQGAFYSGVFDGNNNVARNFNIEGNDYLGFFGEFSGDISNLKLENFDISGIAGSGGIARSGGLGGVNYYGTVANCCSSGSVSISGGGGGYANVGGLLGVNYGTITNCHSTCEVFGSGNYANGGLSLGGLLGVNFGEVIGSNSRGDVNGISDYLYLGCLVGSNDSGDIMYCYSTGNGTVSSNGVINGSSKGVGGLVGKCNDSTIANCYSTGDISLTGNGSYAGIGGLIGLSSNLFVTNCYSASEVSGMGNYMNGGLRVGGLLGVNNHNNITNCYASGDVNGTGDLIYVGGFAGVSYGSSISDCYWDTENSKTSIAYIQFTGSPDYLFIPVYSTAGSAEGKTIAEMMTQSTFSGWDFSAPVWRMLRPGEDYPRLAWQTVYSRDIAGLYGVDMIDFAYLANYWGLTGCNSVTDCGRADIDTSDDVGLGDLAAVANDWLK